MFSLPQEIEVWYIIPTIRKELAKAMLKKGLTQEKIASILGVSNAAVSQYMSRKRASKIHFIPKIKKEIEKSADKIARDNKAVVKEIQRLISLMRQVKYCCDVCKKYNKGIISLCELKPKISG